MLSHHTLVDLRTTSIMFVQMYLADFVLLICYQRERTRVNLYENKKPPELVCFGIVIEIE